MRCNQTDTSTFSFKELLEMKEKKPIELMPPPRTPIRTTKDIIQELRKNLTETPSNALQNFQLQEELNKIKFMNRENTYNYNTISSNNFNNITNNINNNTNNSNENDALLTDLDTYLNNNSHNDINLDEENILNKSLDSCKEKEKENFIKFNKLPNPKNKSEIKIFVNNLISYINFLISCPSKKNNNNLNDELFVFKYKLETRYNDYRNHGLNEQYFINKLKESQEELINKIGIGIVSKKDKKEDSLNSLNLNSIINIRSNYTFIGKKRKKSLSEMRSITDGSSSYEEGEGDSH